MAKKKAAKKKVAKKKKQFQAKVVAATDFATVMLNGDMMGP